MRTKAKLAVGGTSQVWGTGIKRHVASVVDKLERSRRRSTVATTSNFTATIQHKLNAQVDVINGTLNRFWLAIIPRDLDSIRKAGERTVSPA